MITSTVKSITLKLNTSTEGASYLEGNLSNQFGAFQYLMNEVVNWSGEKYYTYKEGEFVEIDGEAELVKIYNKTNKSFSFNSFKKVMGFLYRCFIEDNSRNLPPVIFSPRSYYEIEEDTVLYHIQELSEKFKNKKASLKKDDSLIFEEYLGGIGFYNRTQVFDNLSTSDKYSVIANVQGQFLSWLEVDKACASSYAEDESDISSDLSKIPNREKLLIVKFRDFCVKNDIIKHFNWKVKSYLSDCLIPALVQGKSPERHFYIKKHGGTGRFSLNDSLFDFLLENPDMWQGKEPVIVKYSGILNKIFIHSKHKPRAAFPIVKDGDFHRLRLKLGHNYTSYSFDNIGESVGDIEISTRVNFKDKLNKCINGVSDPRISLNIRSGGKEWVKIGDVLYRQRYRNGEFNPSSYFQNLKIWEISKDCAKEAYVVSFNKRGERMYGVIREPSVVRRRGAWQLEIPFTAVKKDNINWRNFGFYKKSSLTTKNSDSVVKTVEELKGKEVRTVGIDLGQTVPFAYAVLSETVGVDGSHRVIDEGLCEQTNLYSHKYEEFLREISLCFSINGKYRENEELKEEESEFFKTVVEFCRNSNLGDRKKALLKPYENPIEGYMANAKLAQGKLAIAKLSFGSVPSLLNYYISAQFNKIKNERKFFVSNDPNHRNKISDDFKWVRCINQLKSFKRSISKMGTGNETKPVHFKHLNELMDGVKNNFRKQLAADIVKTTLKYGGKIIAVEQLEFSSDSKTKKENLMMSLWSAAAIKESIENAASWHGIQIVEVSEAGTSQVHYETKGIGYRDGRWLHYEENGKLNRVHADINAAKMIGERCVTKHGNLSVVYLGSKKENKGEETMGKWQAGFIGTKYGNLRTGKKILSDFLKNELEKEKDDAKICKNGAVWYHMGNPMTQMQKNEHVKRIKGMCESLNGDPKHGSRSRTLTVNNLQGKMSKNKGLVAV